MGSYEAIEAKTGEKRSIDCELIRRAVGKKPKSGAPRLCVVVCTPERRKVTSEVQFEVAPNTVTEITDLRPTRLRTWQREQREKQIVARLKLGSCRHPEPIDLGLRRAQRLTVERRQTPGESIHKRVEILVVYCAVHPAITLGDIGIEIVTAK